MEPTKFQQFFAALSVAQKVLARRLAQEENFLEDGFYIFPDVLPNSL